MIKAVEEGRYRLKDQKGAILPLVYFNYLSDIIVKLIIFTSCNSISSTPPYTSSSNLHPPPPLVTITEIPVIIVNQELLPKIGGYGSRYILIIIVAKAASEYLDRGRFKQKEEAKTLLKRVKKAIRGCINGIDNTN